MNIRESLYTYLVRNCIPLSQVTHGEAYCQDLVDWDAKGLYGITLPKDFSLQEWRDFREFFNEEYKPLKKSWSIVIYLEGGRYLELGQDCIWGLHDLNPNESSFVIHEDFLNFIWRFTHGLQKHSCPSS